MSDKKQKAHMHIYLIDELIPEVCFSTAPRNCTQLSIFSLAVNALGKTGKSTLPCRLFSAEARYYIRWLFSAYPVLTPTKNLWLEGCTEGSPAYFLILLRFYLKVRKASFHPSRQVRESVKGAAMSRTV